MRGWLVIVGCLFTSLVSAEVFRWVDADGRVHFGDQPPAVSEAGRVELRINTYESPSISENDLATGAREIVMYSAAWCAVCKKTKRYFEKNGILFVEYDIETSEQGKRDYRKLGGRGVPIILVGDKRLNGFSAAAFEKIYNSL
ncbi:MAG: DUF4124 domain-containing protein [Gammaproteobacteria bacterium]|nr:DUF4124 domain-containing protein [Gammaproteobacteria bacterium]